MPQNSEERKFGNILKDARLSKNMSLEDVSKGTKIHPNILKSIEADDVSALGAVYAKSFIRIYADFLGLDKEDLLRRYEGLKNGSEEGRLKEVRLKSMASVPAPDLGNHKYLFDVLRKIPWGRVIVVIVLAFVLWNFGKFLHKKKVESALKKKIEIQVPVEKEGKQKKEASAKILENKSSPVVKTKKDSSKTSVSKVSKTAQSKKASDATTKQAPLVKNAEKLLLVIRTKEKTWLQVKVDGKIVFQGVLAKGVADSWQAEERMELWLGNAGVVQLELNGRLLEKIGRPGQTLKRVLVTRSGLSIEK
jgi:cytoskeletal protein RodZ